MNLQGIAIASHPPAVIPEIGGARCIQAEKTVKGLKKFSREIARIKPDTIVCITPHGNVFRDGVSVLYDTELTGCLRAFCSDDASAAKTKITKKCDMTLLDNLRTRWQQNDCRSLFINPAIAEDRSLNMQLDHGVLVPLYYINKVYSNFKIVHITISDLSLIEHYRMGRILREAIEIGDQRVAILACADLSHYHRQDEDYSPLSTIFDQIIIESIKHQNYYDLLTCDPKIYEPAGQCGLRPIIMALGAVDSIRTRSEIYAYEAPFGVGYLEAFIRYDLSLKDPITESLLTKHDANITKAYALRKAGADCISGLALQAVETWVKDGVQLNADTYFEKHKDEKDAEILNTCAGVFVTITKCGECRGCMGTIHAVTENIAHEIVRNSIQAAGYDPRFLPIEETELPYLQTEVNILYDFQPVEDQSQLDPKNYGIIAEKDLQRGLLLPDLPGIDTIQKQIQAVKAKAGIEDEEGGLYLTRFKTLKYSN